MLRKGHSIHGAIQSYLLGEQMETDEEAKPYMASVASQIDKFHDIQACEMHLTHGSLPYCGVVDCVAQYNGYVLMIVIVSTYDSDCIDLGDIRKKGGSTNNCIVYVYFLV